MIDMMIITEIVKMSEFIIFELFLELYRYCKILKLNDGP